MKKLLPTNILMLAVMISPRRRSPKKVPLHCQELHVIHSIHIVNIYLREGIIKVLFAVTNNKIIQIFV